MKKLTSLKLDLKKWNETEFGIVTFNKWQLWIKLNALDREETHTLTAEEKLEQINLRTEIEKFILLEEINGIESLLVNGSSSYDQGMIENCITQFFINLYSEQQVIRPFPDVLEFPMIS